LLERLNKMSADNFVELTNQTKEVSTNMQQIQDKAKELQPCFDEIDVLEASASELLNTAQLLDDYSKRIGERNF
jgi:ABC-type transporter Mla subunit MlaD